ncbi:MAG: hypothetical protein LBO08_01390 [Rickettsiales bacterium]|jgi:hypothetical protein|nr:hypothetical protein [Rickettsiales bacterium]
MDKIQMEKIMHKLHHKRNLYLRAFVINLILVVIFWLVSKTGWYMGMIENVMICTEGAAVHYTYTMIGLWKIAGLVLFLVPGLAAAWELQMCKK